MSVPVAAQPSEATPPRSIQLRSACEFAPSCRRVLLPKSRQIELCPNFGTPTKPLVWLGRDPLPQLPFAAQNHGKLLVVSLFDGVGALLVALLALSLSFVAVAVESDVNCSSCVDECFENLVSFADAATLQLSDFLPLLEGQDFDDVLIFGGAPCQGESSLNKQRKGLADPRSQLAWCVPRLADLLEGYFQAAGKPTCVWRGLENVFHCTNDFNSEVSKVLGMPFATQALDWGWESRKRKWWLAGPQGPLRPDAFLPPAGIQVIPTAQATLLQWKGKPLPKAVHFKDGFLASSLPAATGST